MESDLEKLDKLARFYYRNIQHDDNALNQYLKIVETKQRMINSTLKEERDKYYTLSQHFYKLLETHYKSVFTSENLENIRQDFQLEAESLAVDLFVSGRLDPTLLSPFKSE